MRGEDLKKEWLAEWDKANKLFEQGKETEAEACLAKCAKLSPETWAGLGLAQLEEKDLAGAIRRFEEAYAFASRPQTKAICLNNIGSILADSGYRSKAMEYFLKCIKLFPWYPDAFANVGLCHKWRGEIDEALRWLDMALQLNPHHQQASFTRSLVLLLDGRMPEGWDAYETRFRMRGGGVRKLEIPWPEWDGTQKRVVVYGEQGIGDNIQMLRYASVMRQNGHEVQFIARKPIKSLFEYSGQFTRVYEIGEQFQDFDSHISAFSLPKIHRTTIATIPLADGYIPKPPLSDVMEYGPGLNVGVFWSGSTAYKQNIFRTTHITEWREVLEVPGITWHSLQVGNDEAEAGLFPQLKVYPTPEDYLETARRISGLDLVISIDSGIVHLTGAMGIPVWILVPDGGDFRWMIKSETTPWYSSARLFRSPGDFQWEPVFKRIANELRAKVGVS
jgi:hypothetical protein